MNITQLIYKNAQKHPYKKAIVTPTHYDSNGRISYTHYTYEQFVECSQNLCKNLDKVGVKKDSKVLLFVKPSLEFSLLVFSLFGLGAIPVLIDPGVGRKNLLSAIAKVKPDILIAEPIVHIIRRFFPGTFSSIQWNITTKKSSLLTSSISLLNLVKDKALDSAFRIQEISPQSTAAIVYTSGATGSPKGVIYTHSMFYEQVQMLKSILPMKENSVDLSCFPLFSLFSIAMGMTSVIPWLNAAKPASADPKILLQHIQDQGITLATGSPAIWHKLADYCVEKNIQIPSIEAILMFGAPVSLKLHEQMKTLLPNGNTYTPYGATECLPVSWISGREILKDHFEKTLSGAGTCIGSPVQGCEVRIIESSFEAIPQIHDTKEVPPYHVGEIIVSGPQATQEYFENREDTRKAKIYEEKRFWHRMGDVGYKDEKGLLWFCGRKSHQVSTKRGMLYPIPVESIFNQHPLIKRSALIRVQEGHSNTVAVVLERKDRKTKLSSQELNFLRSGLVALGRKYPHTEHIDTFFLYGDFPVDCRHNIKIDRVYLSEHFSKNRDLAF